MQIVAISGHAGSGKDTAAKALREELETCGCTVLVTHYADLVKYVCRAFFGWDGEKDEYGRSLLQRVGTDVVRRQDPDFWVDFIIRILKFFNESWDYVLIPDARFPNEIRSMKDAGFRVVHLRIERPHYDNGLTEEQKNHPSETSLDHMEPDYTIVNDGSLEYLNRLVRWFSWVLQTPDEENEKEAES